MEFAGRAKRGGLGERDKAVNCDENTKYKGQVVALLILSEEVPFPKCRSGSLSLHREFCS